MATPKGERKRAALIAAAAELLVGAGLEAVGHRAVAERARVPLGTTTYYFAALDDLRAAAVDHVVGADLARMDATIAALTTRGRTAGVTARLLVALLTPPDADRVLGWYERYVGAARHPVLADGARRTNAAARAHAATALERCGWAGRVDPRIALAVVDGAVVGALAEGADTSSARAAATDALAEVLDLARR